MARIRPPRKGEEPLSPTAPVRPPNSDGEALGYTARMRHPMYAGKTPAIRNKAREAWDKERRRLLELDLKDGAGRTARFIEDEDARYGEA